MNLVVRKIKTLARLDKGILLLLLPALLILSIAHLLLLFFPFKKIQAILGELNQESPFDQEEEQAKVIGQTIQIVSKYAPWDAACYTQALTAKIILKTRKINATTYMGVCKDEQTNTFKGHAWLRVGRHIVTGKKGHKKFQIIAYYS